jgi:hypothetical protein
MVEFRSVEQTDGSGPVEAENYEESVYATLLLRRSSFSVFSAFLQVKGIPFDATDPEVSGKDLFR